MSPLTNATIDELSPPAVAGGLAAAILIGMLYCFVGYRVFRFLLGLGAMAE